MFHSNSYVYSINLTEQNYLWKPPHSLETPLTLSIKYPILYISGELGILRIYIIIDLSMAQLEQQSYSKPLSKQSPFLARPSYSRAVTAGALGTAG